MRRLKFLLKSLWLFFVQPRYIYGWKDPARGFLGSTRFPSTAHIMYPENIKMGEGVFIGHCAFIDAQAGLEIGEGAQIGLWTTIVTHSSHLAIRLYGKEYFGRKNLDAYFLGPVKIGPYTFVGPHSIIQPGTTIGRGCLVAAYSRVKGNFPEFSVIAGNPATVVGSTKDLDAPWLEKSPELKAYYDEWVNRTNGLT